MDWVNPAPAAGAALLRDGRVLLSRRARAPKQGQWDLVGGFLEPGEDAEAGMRREVEEETACRAAGLRLHAVLPGDYDGRPTLNLLYTGTLVGEPVAQDDSLELRWFPLDGLPDLAWPHEGHFLGTLADALRATTHDASPPAGPAPRPTRPTHLGDLTWPQAEALMGPDTVVVLPLAAGSKEHGPHLPLGTDAVLANHFADRLDARGALVVAPLLAYHHYPAFVAYPGSASLDARTAEYTVVDIVRSYARHGPRRFYVLNTGLSTVPSLRAAKDTLTREGILLAWTDWHAAVESCTFLEQPAGTHADESETSLMLHIAPGRVDMAKAVREVPPFAPGPWRRSAGQEGGLLSPSGVYGDATMATADKGRRIAEAIERIVAQDIRDLRTALLPP